MVIIVVLVGGFWVYKNKRGGAITLTPGETAEVSGVAVVVNADQIAFDGPYLISLKTEGGETVNVAVPSMGLPLCAAYQAGNITGVNLVKIGDQVEVKGKVAQDGAIVPCDAADHYLRN